MKKTPITTLLALLVLALVPLAAAQTTPTSNPVQVSLLSYQPVPAQAGETLDVQLSVRNSATSPAQGVEIEVLSGGAFIAEGRTTVNAGTIPALNSFTARFTVRVQSTAEAGDRALQIRTRQQGQDWQQTTIFIPIVSQQAAILVTDVSSQNMIPGETGTLTLRIENLADTTLRDITVRLGITDTPFTPAQTATQQHISSLAPGAAQTVTYRINTRATATPGDYAFPVTMHYLDSAGNQRENDDTISIRVNAPARTDAYVDNVERQGNDAVVRMRIINMGLSEIRFVTAQIEDGEGYSVHPQSRRTYVGNINSDDWETVRFTITSEQDELTVPITYTFFDAFNQEHTITEEHVVRIPSQDSGTRAGLWIVLLILAAVIGTVVYRKRRHKKK